MSVPQTSQLSDQAWGLAEAGRLREAEALFSQLCQLAPEDAEAWMMRGALQVELGDRGDAVRCLRRSLELDPDYADPYLHLGKLALTAPDAAEARRCAEKALAIDPDYPEAWLLLGSVHAASRNHPEVESCARKVLGLEPDNVQAALLLAQALNGQGRTDEAAGLYRQLLARCPDLAEARLRLAGFYGQIGQFKEAEAEYRQILRSQPGQVDAWRGLGDLLMAARRHAEAAQAYQSVLQIQPACPGIYNNLGNACFAQGDMVNAEAWFRKALALPDVQPEVHANLGLVLQSRGELVEAVACYEKALSGKPDSPDFHLQMALGLESLGRFDEAVAHCDAALRLDPGSQNALAGKAGMLQKQGEYRQSRDLLQPLVDGGGANGNAMLVYAEAEARVGDAERATALLETILEGNNNPIESQKAHAILGELYDKRGEYDRAFHHYTASNRLKQGQFDPRRHEAYVGRLISTYTPELLASRLGGGSASELPVFIVGMPRSGTSLVEQILASHPAVFGAGELSDIQKITHALSARYQPVRYPECMGLAGFDVLKPLADGYLAGLRSLDADAARVTDKMPHNFLHLGLIQMLFPKARVIHIRRDPLDTCLSCYFQEFSASHSYAYDLTQLGEYYRQYERLMARWDEVLDLPVLHIRYEDLVDDQEGVTRRMVEFCGLEWDERVLRFHETRRNVATPSFDQVRQPMYRKSLQRWKNYEAHLAPLVAALK